MDLEGVVVPMVTPVTGPAGGIDVSVLRELTAHLVDHGVDGLFACGTTGEFSCLTREQRQEVIGTVVRSQEAVPVVAGCGATNPRDVLALASDAAAVGADVAAVVTPYYHTATQDGLAAFYRAVADESPLPVLLYHIPHQTGQELHPSTVARLADHDSIIGMKDSSGDVRYLNELVRSTPDSFSVLQGGLINVPTAVQMGADGVVPGQANAIPSVVVDCYEEFAAGETRSTSEPYRTVNELSRSFLDVPVISAVKYLTCCAGFDVGPPLPPLSELDDGTKSRLSSQFESLVD
jgi:4-hydroxy-tetrahydrodipicolinate synthase